MTTPLATGVLGSSVALVVNVDPVRRTWRLSVGNPFRRAT